LPCCSRPRPTGAARRRTLWWLLGLLLLVLASVVALVLYLNAFEHEEEERRRVSDGQWLEHSTRFHFTRLEEDLLAQARRAAAAPLRRTGQPATAWQGGLLWTEPGAVLWHNWHAAERGPLPPQLPPEWQTHTRAHPDNTDQLASMADIAVGLRRPAYGGPMQRADGSLSDVVWLAVPLFERGRYPGAYLAALSMDACVQGLVPTWLRQQHAVRLAADGETQRLPCGPMNLRHRPVHRDDCPVHHRHQCRACCWWPACFAGHAGALWALRRDMGKRQRVRPCCKPGGVARGRGKLHPRGAAGPRRQQAHAVHNGRFAAWRVRRQALQNTPAPARPRTHARRQSTAGEANRVPAPTARASTCSSRRL
jgi:two-component system sensor histidine kinase DctS